MDLVAPLAFGILVPWPGIKPAYPASQSGFLNTGTPGRSYCYFWRMIFVVCFIQGLWVFSPTCNFLPSTFKYVVSESSGLHPFRCKGCSHYFCYSVNSKYVFWGELLLWISFSCCLSADWLLSALLGWGVCVCVCICVLGILLCFLCLCFVLFLFIYLFGCARFYLTSLVAQTVKQVFTWQHVGCSSLDQGSSLGPLHWERRVLATR